jgi:hypothetical protein
MVQTAYVEQEQTTQGLVGEHVNDGIELHASRAAQDSAAAGITWLLGLTLTTAFGAFASRRLLARPSCTFADDRSRTRTT